jgi:hypothetical protein
MMKKQPQARYSVLIGFNYGKDNRRHEAGEQNITLPAVVALQLLAHNPPVIAENPSPSPEGAHS